MAGALEYRAAVDSGTGRFLYGGWVDLAVSLRRVALQTRSDTAPESLNADERSELRELQRSTDYDVEPGLSPGQIRVVLTREPDRINERYTGDPVNPFRAATLQEIQAAATADAQVSARRELGSQTVVEALAEAVSLELAAVTREAPAVVKQRLVQRTEDVLTARRVTAGGGAG